MSSKVHQHDEPWLPRLRTFDDLIAGLGRDQGITLVEPVVIPRKQMRELLPEMPKVLEPVGFSSGMEFFPFEGGFVGVPFCQSGDPRVTCFPQGPGPDDDPRGFVCVCFGDIDDDEPVIPIPEFKQPEPCALEIDFTGRKPLFGCRNQRCGGTCRFGRLRGAGRFVLGCDCR